MKVIMKPIEIMAHFSADGYITPYRMRYKDAQQSNIIVQIDNILKSSVNTFAGNIVYVYECNAIIDDIQKRFEIKYETKSNIWFLSKI